MKAKILKALLMALGVNAAFPLEYLDLSYRLCCNLPWVVTPKIELNTKQTVVKTEHFTAVFLYPFLGRT